MIAQKGAAGLIASGFLLFKKAVFMRTAFLFCRFVIFGRFLQ
jgi:hypothetical protein